MCLLGIVGRAEEVDSRLSELPGINTNYSATFVPVLALVCVLGGRGCDKGPTSLLSVNQTVVQLPLAMGLYVDDRPCSWTRKSLGLFDVQPG